MAQFGELAQVPQELKVQIGNVVNRAQSFPAAIATDTEYAAGGELVKALRGAEKAAEQRRKSIVDPINTGLKNLNQMFKDMLAPVGAARNAVQATLDSYLAEKDRRQRELQAQRDREAQEKRDAEAATAKAEADRLAQQAVDAETARVTLQAKAREAEADGNVGAAATFSAQATDAGARADALLHHAAAADEVHEEIATAPVQAVEVVARTTVYSESGVTTSARRRRVVKLVSNIRQVPYEYLKPWDQCIKTRDIEAWLAQHPAEHVPGIEDEMEVKAVAR